MAMKFWILFEFYEDSSYQAIDQIWPRINGNFFFFFGDFENQFTLLIKDVAVIL